MVDKLLDIQIVRAISAVGPLTRKQIINRINDDAVDVEASLDALVTMNCLRTELSTCFKGDFEYRLAPNFSERECKLSEHRQKIAMYVSRHGSDSKVVMPVTSGIAFSEGLDRAIWKAANTGQWMSVAEIRNTLMKVGFRKSDVVTRVQHHINTGKWFDRQMGRHKNQFFMLRNDIECPELPGSKPAERGNTRVVSVLDDAGYYAAPVVSPTMVTARTLAQDLIAQEESKTGGYFPLSIFGEEAMKVAHEQAALLIKKDGTLHEAIWALMDGEEYSLADIQTLLQPFGYTDKQISPIMSKRFADGLLSRRLVQVDGKWVNVYKKEKELPAKFTSNKSVVSAMIEAQQPTEDVVIASQAAVKAAEVQVNSNVSVSSASTDPVELFSNKIRIKGVVITLAEFSALYKDLSDAGFVREYRTPTQQKASRMLSTTHVIKGIEFTREEVIELTGAMHRVATEFKNAVNV